MIYNASQAQIVAVENGFLIHLNAYGSSITLVAANMKEVIVILNNTEFRSNVRPIHETRNPSTNLPFPSEIYSGHEPAHSGIPLPGMPR